MALRVTFPRLRGLARWIGLAALFFATALFGTAGGVMFAFSGDLPAISALDDYSPGVITRVLARDGSVVGEFATERRQLVTYEEIPEVLRNAIISAEDGDFMRHGGMRPELMFLAFLYNFSSGLATEAIHRTAERLRHSFGFVWVTLHRIVDAPVLRKR